jgi:2-oxoglutarate ferredoxin oxidoreductase subunit beta
MVTTTTPRGRDTLYTGAPVDASKMLASLDGPSYVKRVFLPIAPLKSGGLYSAAGPLEGARSVVNAFKVQLAGGFSFVEFVSTCSINWKMSVLDSKKYAADVLSKVFPPGLYKDKLGIEKR